MPPVIVTNGWPEADSRSAQSSYAAKVSSTYPGVW